MLLDRALGTPDALATVTRLACREHDDLLADRAAEPALDTLISHATDYWKAS